jgi:hypothetical protein
MSSSEVAGALASVRVGVEGLGPVYSFGFDRADLAREFMKRIHGYYEIVRESTTPKRAHLCSVLSLRIGKIVADDHQYYVLATLEVPAEGGYNFQYKGLVCQRSNLMYWMFSQDGVFLDDLIFIVSERLSADQTGDLCVHGSMITMGQVRPEPIMSTISIRRAKSKALRGAL